MSVKCRARSNDLLVQFHFRAKAPLPAQGVATSGAPRRSVSRRLALRASGTRTRRRFMSLVEALNLAMPDGRAVDDTLTIYTLL